MNARIVRGENRRNTPEKQRKDRLDYLRGRQSAKQRLAECHAAIGGAPPAVESVPGTFQDREMQKAIGDSP